MNPNEFTFEQHLEYCFLPPCKPEELPAALHNPELRPVLHLLRRDIELIYGEEKISYRNEGMKPPFVVLLAILCGFDMLSAMLFGDDPISEDGKKAQALLDSAKIPIKVYEVGKKYQRFLREVSGLSERDAAFLYVLRNSLAHTYSLNVSTKAYRYNSVTTDPPNGHLIEISENMNPKKYIVNVWELKRCYLHSIDKLKELLQASKPESDLRSRFKKHVKESGYIVVECPVKQPPKAGA